MILNSADLVVAGLALDILGALILVRGLFVPRAEIITRARTVLKVRGKAPGTLSDVYRVDNPTQIVAMVESMADGAFGALFLLSGFLLQLLGAFFALAGHHGKTGGQQVMFSVVVLVTIAGIVLVAYPYGRRHIARLVLDWTVGDDDPRLRDVCRNTLAARRRGGIGPLARRHSPDGDQ